MKPTKKGHLELRQGNTWTRYFFVLDERTHSLSYYSVDAVAESTSAQETIVLDQLSGVAAIPFEDAANDVVIETDGSSNSRPRVCFFQLRLTTDTKVCVCVCVCVCV